MSRQQTSSCRTRRTVALLFVVWAAAAPASGAPQAAKSADAFIDSIGVNTHYGNAVHVGGNAYANPRVDAKLAELGVRHLRDHTWNDIGLARIDRLFKTRGIRTTLVVGETTRSPAELVKLLKQHPAYEAIEGLNEPDFAAGRTYKGLTDDRKANSYPATQAFQNDLYAAIKADPKTMHVLVLSPAMGRAARSKYLMPIEFDVAAMHSYAWAAPKSTSHEPSLGVDAAIKHMAALRGAKPLWATESGYFNRSATDTRLVPESVAAKYVPRLFAEFFNRGVARTYLYELADQGKDAAQREQNFGLLRFDLTEKPAFTALKNLIALLQEPRARDFEPASLDYALSLAGSGAGDLGRVHHTLLQKSDGTFYLLLWHESPGFDRAKQAEIQNPPVPVKLTLNVPMRDAATYLINRSAKPAKRYANPAVIELDVPDEMLVVQLSPTKR